MVVNFNQPQRQSSIGILVMFFDSLQKFIRAFVTIIFLYVLKFREYNLISVALIVIALIVVVAIIAYFRYLNFTFYIDDENDEFIVSEGIFNKTKTTIQLNRIQQVNIHQNLLQRIINIYSLSVDTAGSEKKEGNIKAISHSLALALKAKLLENESKSTEVASDEDASENLQNPTSENHPFLRINVLSLIKVGITSNYVKSVGLILTFFFTIAENLHQIGQDDLINRDKIENVVDSYPIIYGILFFILVMFTVIFILNIGRTLLKFFNYSITKQKGSLLLSYGLINTESTILKPEKVQIVKVFQNYFQKKLNVLEIKIKQASGDDDTKDKKSQIEIPGCNTLEKEAILKLIFKQLPEKGVMLKPNWRKLGFSIFLTIMLPLAGFFTFGKYIDKEVFQYSHFAIAYTVFFMVILFFAFRNYRIFINDNHIIKQSGAWDIENEIIEIKKIQAITTSQLFWHKNLNIGSITLHTAGGNIGFQLGNYSQLQNYINLWLYEIETSDSNWM